MTKHSKSDFTLLNHRQGGVRSNLTGFTLIELLPVTLPTISFPTPGGGTGVLEAGANGWNGTNKYFQFSN